ncbi:glycoside hydrolase family 66 protein [Echinicola sediminis]
MMYWRRILCFLTLALLGGFYSCQVEDKPGNTSGNPSQTVELSISTDLSIYAPGEQVKLELSGDLPQIGQVRYRHLGEIVAQHALQNKSWEWTAPSVDFKGYLVEIVEEAAGEEKVLASIGVDISSDWTKFPRYGFLSKFPEMSKADIAKVLDHLNRHHINGLQFYDWHYQHHDPLAGTAENPDPVWKDIINREIYFETVKQYIADAHDRGMKAMFYNLIFGALNTAEQEGVSPEWFLYTDGQHQEKDKHPLPKPPFASDIFLVDPSNGQWQAFLSGKNQEVYTALPFDGFHMDQLGNRNKALYTYDGNPIGLEQVYNGFITAMKSEHPQKELVMNAVNQYGQEGIADAPTGFLYTEVWGPNEQFKDLAKIIQENDRYGNGHKNSVLAAYMNYDLANHQGYFNTPSVLLTDAVIFAFGGAHLELGEHMLGKEYFPNNNLQMRADLKAALVHYYDFMVAYQNLLRDGGDFYAPSVSGYGQLSFKAWPPQAGNVAMVGKKVGARQVVHLINFSNASHLNWRDNHGTQSYPQKKEDVRIVIESNTPIEKVWMASPDYFGGSPVYLEFKQQGSQVSITLPSIEFWDMIVLE